LIEQAWLTTVTQKPEGARCIRFGAQGIPR
jgi:hypothetical protein